MAERVFVYDGEGLIELFEQGGHYPSAWALTKVGGGSRGLYGSKTSHPPMFTPRSLWVPQVKSVLRGIGFAMTAQAVRRAVTQHSPSMAALVTSVPEQKLMELVPRDGEDLLFTLECGILVGCFLYSAGM